MSVFRRLMSSGLRPPVEAYPLIGIVGLGAVGGTAFSLHSLFRKPDVFLTNARRRSMFQLNASGGVAGSSGSDSKKSSSLLSD